jgi:hypothetical protein
MEYDSYYIKNRYTEIVDLEEKAERGNSFLRR